MNTFELDPEDLPFLLGEDPAPGALGAPQRRASDPRLLERRAAAVKAFQPEYEKFVASFLQRNSDLCAGLAVSGGPDFRPAQTRGQSAVLLRLVQVILSPASAARTQQECREIVEAQFPSHAVYKTWTKPLPKWALSRAKSIIAGAPPPLSSLKLRAEMTLKELHNAVKAAVEGKGTRATVLVAITEDAVLVNGHRFKRTVNRAKGKEYPIVRLPIPALEAALHAKPKAS